MALGLLLWLGEVAAELPEHQGTPRDSGYPCRIDRSDRTTQYLLFQSDTKISVPLGDELAASLVLGGAIGLSAQR